ncbi:MAG: hypothetical protein IPM35_02610 [Myxococcales bacterium]|nr:hypothetical protein [Myxococcales bacterium]
MYTVRFYESRGAKDDLGNPTEPLSDPTPDLAAGQVLGIIEADRFAALRLDLEVTMATGTDPTLDVTLEHGPTAAGPWTALDAFTQATAEGSERLVVGPCDRFVRAVAAIGGTGPAFRLSLTGEGV